MDQKWFSERERIHMRQCDPCQKAWAVFERTYHGKRTPKQICHKWMTMTEVQRLEKEKLLLKREQKHANELLSGSTMNAYQCFARAMHDSKQNFADQMSDMAKKWRQLSDEAKSPYFAEARSIRSKRKQEIDSLPIHLRRQVKRIKSQMYAPRSEIIHRKPNLFQNFLKTKWKEAKELNPNAHYRQVMQEATLEWNEKKKNAGIQFQVE